MSFKVVTSGPAEMRWVRFGLLTHDGESRLGEAAAEGLLTSGVEAPANEAPLDGRQSFYFMDAARLLGRDLERFAARVAPLSVEHAFVVGDLGCAGGPIPNVGKIELLYHQIGFAEFRRRLRVLEASARAKVKAAALYPRWVYAARDVVHQPRSVLRILMKPPTIVFAGQSGLDSLRNVFRQHESNEPEAARAFEAAIEGLEEEAKTCESSARAAENIIRHSAAIEMAVEATKLAQMQSHLRSQRFTIIFKSVLRFVLLSTMANRGWLINIGYDFGFLRVYQSRMYRRHLFVDFGGVNGYEPLYPRMADIMRSELDFYQLSQPLMHACQMSRSESCLKGYIDEQWGNLENAFRKHCGAALAF